MSRALLSRIAKLEARKAKAVPREICVIGMRFSDRFTEDENGVWRRKPFFTEETYAEFARNQQSRLLAELAEFAEQLNEGDDTQAQAPHVGKVTERAPLPPGTKRKRYLHTTKGGKQFETDTHTGQTVEIK